MSIKIPYNTRHFTNGDKNFKKSVLIYILYSDTNCTASWVYIGCILPVSIYMSTTRIVELTVACQNSEPIACKMLAFLQNAISFASLYSGFV